MWKNPVTTTPSILQLDFGPWGQDLPGDGAMYCAPTSMTMGLYWLYRNGFTQLAPADFTDQDDKETINLETVIAGLVGASTAAGTFVDGVAYGIATYLSARGIAPSQYTTTGTDTPDVAWLTTHLAPNFLADPQDIVLSNFAVGWFWRATSTSTSFSGGGGHVLVPLDPSPPSAGCVTLNNPDPSTFLDAPNDNPQAVQIAAVPAGWTLPGLAQPSQDYTQVITPILGDTEVAILWGAQAWAISRSALPSAGHRPQPWEIVPGQAIDTNGGTLTVIAPVTGAGGFAKVGAGSLLLTGTNQSTGANSVAGGILASTQTSGTPFGDGAVTLSGGTLLLSANGVSAKVAIASGPGATFTTAAGGGVLKLDGSSSCVATIGGNTDGATPNIVRTAAGTLVVAPGAGIGQLGTSQQVIVQGSGANLPAVSNGIMAPYLIGIDSDAVSSGSFLDYASAGLVPATVTPSSTVPIGRATSTMIYEVVDQQTIDDGATVQVAALEIDGGTVLGPTGTLQVGSQQAGDVAGVVLNGGDVAVATLSFGASEGLLYVAVGTTISSTIAGTAGVTMFGPGTLALPADNSTSLHGPFSLNSGTLVVSDTVGMPAGATEIVVGGGATLKVEGTVAGPVTVGQSGVLLLDGGTVQGGIDIAAVGDTSAEPGILQGRGQIGSGCSFGGLIQSGPGVGLIEFHAAVTISGDSGFYWRLQSLVDDTGSGPGVGWNGLQFDAPDNAVASSSQGMPFYLDFSLLPDGDPDGGNAFWNAGHTWTLFTFARFGSTFWWEPGNFFYEHGSFDITWNGHAVGLVWAPASAPQRMADRRRSAMRMRAALADRSGKP